MNEDGESELRLADVINFLPDATLVIDARGRVIAWNHPIEVMTGIQATEMLGKGDYEYALPFYGERRPILIDLVLLPRQEFEQKYAHIRREGEILIGETYVPQLKGAPAYLFATAACLRDSSGQVIAAVETIRDITDRKRVEIDLRESSEKLRLIFENAFDGISVYEEFPDEDRRILLECNERYCRMAGRSKDELLTVSDTRAIQRSIENAEAETDWESIRTGQHFSGVFSWIRPDGKENIVEYSAAPTRVGERYFTIGLDRDITERKAAEEAVRANEEQFRLVFENAPIGMSITGPDGRYLRVNQALCNTLGYSAEELLTQDLSTVTSPEDLAENLALREKLLRGEIPYFQMEKQFIHKAGSPVHALLQVGLVRDRQGQPLYFIGQTVDITEHKHAEEALQKSETRYRLLSDISQALSARLDTQGLFELIAEQTARVMYAENMIIALHDPIRHEVEYVLSRNPDEVQPGVRLPLDGCMAGYVVKHCKSVLVQNVTADEFQRMTGVTISGPPAAAWLGVPMVIGAAGSGGMGERVLGVIMVQHYTDPHAYDESDQALLEAIANQAAIALENARLYGEAQQEKLYLQQVRKAEHEQRVLAEALRDIAVVLSSSLDLEQVFEGILSQVARVVPYDAARIMLIRGDSAEVVCVRGHDPSFVGLRIPLVRPNLRRIIESGQPVVVEDTLTHEGWITTPAISWIRSNLAAAIRVRDEIIGFLSLDSGIPYAFTAEHVERLQTFAGQTAIALENARLYSEAQREKQYLQQAQQAERNQRVLAETLGDAAAALTRTLDLDTALETLLDTLRQLVPYDSASVMLLEDATHLVVRAGRGFERWMGGSELGVRFWDTAWVASLRQVLESRQSLLIPDVSEYPAWVPIPGTEYIQSWLGVPLISGGEVIGVYSMYKAEPGFFTEEHARLAEMLAAHGAVAIEHARLLRDLQARNQQLQGLVAEHEQVRKAEHAQRVLAEALRDTAVVLTSSLTLDEIFEGILDQAARVVPFDAASILLIKDEMVEVAHVRNFGRSIIGLQFPLKRPNLLSILETGKPAMIGDTRTDDGWVETQETSWIRSDLSAAIRVGEEVIGFLSLDSGTPYAFTAEHVERLQTFASQTAIALQNARLYSEAQREKQYFESLVLNNPAAVVVIDRDANVLSWNPAAESLFGYPQAEAVGRNIDDLVANEAARAEAITFSRQAGAGNVVHAITRRKRRDGSLVDVELHAVPVIIEGKQAGSLAIYHDISELQQAQQAEREQRVLAETLREAGAALTRTLDLDEALETLLEALRQLVPYDSAGVMLLEDATHLAIRAERDFERWTAATQIGLTFDIEPAGALRQVLQSRQTLLIADTYEFSGWERTPGTEYIRSWLGVPLISSGEVIGLYSMDKAEAGFFTEEHARLAEMLAAHGAVAIEHARLLRDLRASNRQLQGLVTEHEQVRKAEHEQRVLAEALRDITVVLSSSLNLDQVFEGILDHVARVVP